MKRFSLLFFTFQLSVGATLSALAGTAVGNFNFIQQKQFDFRMGYPKTWNLYDRNGNRLVEVDGWFLTNIAQVKDEARASSIRLTFLDNYPAKNDQELLAEIKKAHPQLKWKALNNPDFSVGFSSDQIYVDKNRTQNFEYYFSQKNKVIRIETFRDGTMDGATDVAAILSTIRRTSGKPKIVSISSSQKGPVKVGETFCFRTEVDVLTTDYTATSLTSFEIKGAYKHWSFKTITWDQKDSAFQICFKINEHFAENGLEIDSLSLSASGPGQSTSCDGSPEQSKLVLTCGESNKINYQVPKVLNPQPITQAPQITAIALGATPQSIVISYQSALPLAIGELTYEGSKVSSGTTSQVIYKDQIRGNMAEIEIDPTQISSGFQRILSVMLTDKVGNMGMLQAKAGEAFYKFYSINQPPQQTKIAVISIQGDAP